MRVAIIKKEPHFLLIIERMQQQKGISDKYFNVQSHFSLRTILPLINIHR